jgi:hypothetical protein
MLRICYSKTLDNHNHIDKKKEPTPQAQETSLKGKFLPPNIRQ